MALTLTEWQTAKDELARNRERSGKSQSHIARCAGVAPGYICQIETGERQPSEKVLRAYARECGLDCDGLLFQWHKMPSDLLLALRCNPHLRAMLRRELALEA